MEGSWQNFGSTPHLMGKETKDPQSEREPQVAQAVNPGWGDITWSHVL